MQQEKMRQESRRIMKVHSSKSRSSKGVVIVAAVGLSALTVSLLGAAASPAAAQKKAPAKKPAAARPPLTSVNSTPPQYQIFTRPVFAPMPAGSRPAPAEVFRLGPRLEISACADETEPVTFGVYAVKALTGATVKVSPFVSETGSNRLPADAVSVHIVKPLRPPSSPGEAVPELLVKDDRADLSGAAPDVRLTGDPVTDIPAGTVKQFWVTVRIPRRQLVSAYKGTLTFSAAGVKSTPVALVVNVLPMEIKTAFLQYGIDFRSRLATDAAPVPGQVPVNEQQLAQQLANIRDHGFRLVTLYDQLPALETAVRIYSQADLGPTGPLVVGSSVSSAEDVTRIEDLRSSLRMSPDFLFYYSLPESAASDPTAAGAYADNVRKGSRRKGLVVAPISSSSVFTSLGSSLDVPIYAVSSDVAQNLIATGRRTTTNRDWWSWNISQETPLRNRSLAGFQLYKTGLNSSPLYGAFPGPYQFVPEGSSPFDASAQMAVYPAANGVIDTLQWEAAREGIDDIRYIGALKTVARQILDDEKMKTMPAVKQAVADADTFLTQAMRRNLDTLPAAEYQNTRRKIADQTLKLLTIFRTRGARIPR